MTDCKICSKLKSARPVFSDEDIGAYIEDEPAAIPHITIATKTHFRSIAAAPDYLVAWAFVIANKLSRMLLETLQIEGLNLLVDPLQGHFAIHLIGRFKEDGIKLAWSPKKGEHSELKQLQETLVKAMDGKWSFEERPAKPEPKPAPEQVKPKNGEINYKLRQLRRIP